MYPTDGVSQCCFFVLQSCGLNWTSLNEFEGCCLFFFLCVDFLEEYVLRHLANGLLIAVDDCT